MIFAGLFTAAHLDAELASSLTSAFGLASGARVRPPGRYVSMGVVGRLCRVRPLGVVGRVTGISALVALVAVAVAAPASAAKAPAMFYVGFDKQDITPTQLPFDYLGGEGYQRVGTTVVSPLYVRTLAIAAADRRGKRVGPPIVISALDAQGWFSAYQAGPGGLGVADYGLTQIREAAAAAAHIPVQNISFSSTHSHTAPDGLGVWGGAPTSYMEQVRAAAVKSVVDAVANMQPAWFRHGTADGGAYVYNPIPTDVPPDQYSNPSTWPQYATLTVLQALAWGTEQPIVTLFDFGTHPDILEGSPLISPDWPAETISHITSTYGGDAMFLPGVMGSEPRFPGGDTQPHTNAYLESEEAAYAQEIDGVVDQAIAAAKPVTARGVGAASVLEQVPGTNPLLIGALLVDAPSDVQAQIGVGHIERAIVPPYMTGNVLGIPVSVMRIGDGVLFNTPGEVYSDVFFSAHDQVRAGWYMVGSLTDDQIGYAVMPAEWPVAEAYGVEGPAALYSIGPSIGAQIVHGLLATAARVGFPVTASPADLVADRDPVAAQMEYCVTSGACQAGLP